MSEPFDVWTCLRERNRLTGGLFLLLGLLLVGCSGTAPVADSDPAAQYRAAIHDARTAESSEIVTSLTPIAPYNDSLVWRTTADSARQVLVVTWGASETLPGTAGGDTVTVHQNVWVTVAPQIRRFCRRLDRTGNALDLRLAQRLGLPPDASYQTFAELWVDPSALVRPCPDPEVNDRECGLSFPVPKRHAGVSESHREWFRTLKQTSYGPDGYPFTGLGYTYDWNPKTDDVGPSEFVLRRGQTATVKATYTTGEYCRAGAVPGTK